MQVFRRFWEPQEEDDVRDGNTRRVLSRISSTPGSLRWAGVGYSWPVLMRRDRPKYYGSGCTQHLLRRRLLRYSPLLIYWTVGGSLSHSFRRRVKAQPWRDRQLDAVRAWSGKRRVFVERPGDPGPVTLGGVRSAGLY